MGPARFRCATLLCMEKFRGWDKRVATQTLLIQDLEKVAVTNIRWYTFEKWNKK